MPDAGPPSGRAPLGGPAHFTIFGVPVRVSASFWLMALILSVGRHATTPSDALAYSLLGGVLLFGSILVHELGHAVVARSFGATPAITLHAMGGLTTGIPVGLSRPRKAIVSLAGPFSGLVLGGILAVVWHFERAHLTNTQRDVVWLGLFINIFWTLMNLMPVLPFDGGHLLAAILGPKRILATSVISVTVGTTIALLSLRFDQPWPAILFGSAAISGLRTMRMAWEVSRDVKSGLDAQVHQARDALAAGDIVEAERLAKDVVERARTRAVKNGGWTALAWVEVDRRDGEAARRALANVDPREAIDPFTYAAVEECAGEPKRARDVLDHARRAGMRSPEMTKLHVDLYARDGHLDVATALAIADVAILAPNDSRAVLHAAIDWGENANAALLAERLFAREGNAWDAVDEARARAQMRDVEGALTALAKARRAPDYDGDKVRNDPSFAGLLADARFVELTAP